MGVQISLMWNNFFCLFVFLTGHIRVSCELSPVSFSRSPETQAVITEINLNMFHQIITIFNQIKFLETVREMIIHMLAEK